MPDDSGVNERHIHYGQLFRELGYEPWVWAHPELVEANGGAVMGCATVGGRHITIGEGSPAHPDEFMLMDHIKDRMTHLTWAPTPEQAVKLLDRYRMTQDEIDRHRCIMAVPDFERPGFGREARRRLRKTNKRRYT